MLSPKLVADAFVPQYYGILERSSENMHKFYKESSCMDWPGLDGEEANVSTLSGIKEKIMSSYLLNCSVEIKDIAAQYALEGGIIVVVTGISTGKDNVKMNLHQTFFLAKQDGGGFFVLNDILRFSSVCESVTNSHVSNEDIKQDLTVSAESNAVPSTVSESPASDVKAVEHENVKEAKESISLPVSKDDDSKVAASVPSALAHDREPSVLKPSSVPKVEILQPISVAKVEAPKLSYASMVAKESAVTSPKALKVSVNADNRVSAPAANKPLASRTDAAAKVSTQNIAVPKAGGPPGNFAPKSPITSNGAKNTSSDARGIYIGGLPYDVTKQGVVEVMKNFGLVKRSPDSIQIRRHEDGFCCGFVEFETADGARRAVQAHHVKFGDKESYITYKKSYRGNNDGRGRSPTRGGFQNGNFRANENGEVGNKQRSQSGNRTGFNNNGGQAKGGASRNNRPSDQWQRNGRQRDVSNSSMH